MRAFVTLLKLSVIDLFEYRLDLLFYTIGSLATPLALFAIWLAAYSSGANIPLPRDELVQYYLILLLVNLWTEAWGAPFIMSAIRLGKLSPFLLKPMPYILHQLANNIMEKIIKSIYLIPIIAICFIAVKVSPPSLEIVKIALFLLSITMAFVLNFLINFLTGIAAFWFEEASFIDDFLDLLAAVFSGFLFPLVLLPNILQIAGNFLPYRYTLSLPLEILLGQVTGEKLFWGMLVQLLWLIVIGLAAKYLWNMGIRKYSAVGA